MNLEAFRRELTHSIDYFTQTIKKNLAEEKHEINSFLEEIEQLKETATIEYTLAERTNDTNQKIYLQNFLEHLKKLQRTTQTTQDPKAINNAAQQLVNSVQPNPYARTSSNNKLTLALGVSILVGIVGFVFGAGAGVLLGVGFFAFLLTISTNITFPVGALQLFAIITGGITAVFTGKKCYDAINTPENNHIPTNVLTSQVEKIFPYPFCRFFSKKTEAQSSAPIIPLREEKQQITRNN